MELVEDDRLEPGQHMGGARIGDDERELFRRGDEDVRRLLALALAL